MNGLDFVQERIFEIIKTEELKINNLGFVIV